MLYKADFFSLSRRLCVFPLPSTTTHSIYRAQTCTDCFEYRILLPKAGFSARSCGGVGVRMLTLNNFEEQEGTRTTHIFDRLLRKGQIRCHIPHESTKLNDNHYDNKYE